LTTLTFLLSLHGFPSDHSLDQVKECRFRPKYCYRKFKKFWYQEPGLY